MSYLGPYYVYALIDPQTKTPFYIGKGKNNRIVEHFREPVGLSPEQIIESAIDDDARDGSRKLEKIQQLKATHYGPGEIARVIGRRLSQEAAFDMETCLIKSVYGLQRLTNIQDGHHAERFRPCHPSRHEPDMQSQQDNVGLDIAQVVASGKPYVYGLVNPQSQQVFYVGKGQNERILDHFNDARALRDNFASSEKLTELAALLEAGYTEENIGRILAITETAETALLLESMLIKFVYGYANLTNIQVGHRSHLFRAHGDWALRNGLDIPLIVEKGQERVELLDDFLGQGIDTLLYEIRDRLNGLPLMSHLQFSNARVHGAGELCIDALLDEQITLRIQSRSTRKVQVALIATRKPQKKWLVKHFASLGRFPYKRTDFRFTPLAWHGAANVTSDVDTALQRAVKLMQLVMATNLQSLEPALQEELLGGLPFERDITTAEATLLLDPS